MHLHKPKPVHNWRELATEFGVIVLGILTALGLEQAVESWREREKTEAMSRAIDGELKHNIVTAATFENMVDCSQRQLAALAEAVARHDRARVRELLGSATLTVPDAWVDDAWRAALASDVSERLDEDRVGYSVMYTLSNAAQAKQDRFFDAVGRFAALADANLDSSPEAASAGITELAEMTAALNDLKVLALSFPVQVRATIPRLAPSPAEYAARPTKDAEAKCEAQAAALDSAQAGG